MRLLIFLVLLSQALATSAQYPQMVRVDEVKVVPYAQTVPLLGKLVTTRQGAVAAQVDGKVKEVLVQVGDVVKQGQALIRIDTRRLKNNLTQAKARLREEQANLETMQAEVVLAELELRRLKRLKDKEATSQAAYDDAIQNLAIARAKGAEARAGITTAEASKQMAALNLSDATVRAPYRAVVVSRAVSEGSYVRIGSEVVKLVSDTSLEVEADLPSSRLGGMPTGTSVLMQLDDGSEHQAVVRAIVPQEDNRTRTRVVRLTPKFTLTDKPMASGQTVRLFVPAGESRQVLTVHKDAVISDGTSSSAFIVNAEGKAEPRTLSLGVAVGNRLEVVDGLQAGEKAIVRGNERLQPDQPVTIDSGSAEGGA